MTQGYEWLDETHDSVDDFIEAVSTDRPRIKDIYLRQMGIDHGVSETLAQFTARLRREGRPIPDRRRPRSRIRWFANRHVWLFAGAFLALLLAVNLAWTR